MNQVKRHPEKRRIPIVCGLCNVNETTAGCGVDEYDKFFLTEEQAAVVKDFIAALDNEIEEQTRRAYRSGSNMLARLVSGELSIDDVNKMAIRREGKE